MQATMDPNGLSSTQRLEYFRSVREILFPEPGREVEAILKELQKMKPLVLRTLDDAQGMEFRDGTLTVTLANDDIFAKRLREAEEIFRDNGLRLFGHALKIRVRIDSPKPSPAEDGFGLFRISRGTPHILRFIARRGGNLRDRGKVVETDASDS
jgi:hypothetical protein